MIFHGSGASPGARTNGSPLPKRHSRRAGIGARATITHGLPYGLRGGVITHVRRLRSEPAGKDGLPRRSPRNTPPTCLSPTAPDWVPRQASSGSPTTSTASMRAKSPKVPLMSYAAVARLSKSRPPLAPLPPPPPPPFPIIVEPVKTRPGGSGHANANSNANGNGRRDSGSNPRQPSAKFDSTVGARIGRKPCLPPGRRSTIRRQQSTDLTDGGVSLSMDDLVMVDVPDIDLPSITVASRRSRSEMLEKAEPNVPGFLAQAAPRTTPQMTPQTSPARLPSFGQYTRSSPMSASVSKTTPYKPGFYSPMRGEASRLGFDKSPFFPSTLSEYNRVLDATTAETIARNRDRTHTVPTWTCSARQSALPNLPTVFGTASKLHSASSSSVEETASAHSPWLEDLDDGGLEDTHSSILGTPARTGIKYKELDGPMRKLLDYIDKPEA